MTPKMIVSPAETINRYAENCSPSNRIVRKVSMACPQKLIYVLKS
jgi:hypothetical protein